MNNNNDNQEHPQDILTIPSVLFLRLEESLKKIAEESIHAVSLTGELQESLSFYKSEDKLNLELVKTLLKKFKIYINVIQDLLEP